MDEPSRWRSRSADPGVDVAASLRTLPQVTEAFFRFGSPRVLLVGFGLASAIRLVVAATGVAPFGRWDLPAVLVVALLAPVVEWVVHRLVLHLEPRHWRGLLIDPGVGHREHHANPSSINWVVLRTVDAGLFQAVNGVIATIVVGVPLWLAGQPVAGPALTAVVAASAALAHYEWSHFLFHTAYRPKTRRYRRLKANHRRHHHRDERAWLGITSNLADRVLGTLPASGR